MPTKAEEARPPLFSSLPNDIVLNILARVPRHYNPILSCVSKELRSLVRSFELQITRSRLGKARFYVCFKEFASFGHSLNSYHWFTFTETRPCLVSIPFPCLDESYSATVTLGPEIYFVGGSKSMWIFDSRSGKLRQGPRSLVARDYAAVGLVNDKIYIFGGGFQKEHYKDIEAQVFDLKTQTWQLGPNPNVNINCLNKSVVTPSLGRKIYALDGYQHVIVYDTRDGICDKIIRPKGLYSKEMCVVDNVIYMYYGDVGLMWYEFKDKEWRVVDGLMFKGEFGHIAMAEYNGKLAFMWHNMYKMETWCAMIGLYGSSKVAIRGQVEWSRCLLSKVPRRYYLNHFMVCTDY